jgi:hypothetical protein
LIFEAERALSQTSPSLVLEAFDFFRDRGKQRGNTVVDGAPDPLFGDVVVVVAINVSDSHIARRGKWGCLALSSDGR